ncbi:MAG: cytidine/deoxycytidylate deaminase family protein [bacterium]
MSRPEWSTYFMDIAGRVASRSTCPRRAVGAVIVKEKRILATGYNGAPSGMDHCTDIGCLMVEGHCVRTLHAEQNAIIQAAQFGVSTKGAEIYTTSSPCLTCAKMIINAGIRKVWYWEGYPDELAAEFLHAAGVEMVKMDMGEPLNEHLDAEPEGA